MNKMNMGEKKLTQRRILRERRVRILATQTVRGTHRQYKEMDGKEEEGEEMDDERVEDEW